MTATDPQAIPTPDSIYDRPIPPEVLAAGTGPFYSADQQAPVQAQAPEVDLTEKPIQEQFDPRWTQDLEGLLYVGMLQRTITVPGHKITIRTVASEDFLLAGLVIKKYLDTVAAVRALQCGTLAACLVKVDGRSIPGSLMLDDPLNDFETRFNWVLKMHPAVVDAIYEEYLILEDEVTKFVRELGKEPALKTALSDIG